MRKNNILKSISFVLLLALIIFIFWKDKGSVTAKFLQITSWSFFFYHLFKKEYIGLLVHSMFVFLILVLAEFLQFSGDVTTSAYSALVFSLSFFYIMANRLLPTFKVVLKILYGFFSSIILIIPLSFMLFQLQFGSTVSKEVLYAFFQTNHKEGVEYVNEFISLEFICLLISILFISWAFIALQSSGAKKVRWSALLFIASICYFSLSPALAVFDMFWESAITYKKELDLFDETASKMSLGDFQINAFKKGMGETHIVVLGESLNKSQMSVYGYPMETTPNFDQLQNSDGFILFDKAIANHTHTIEVLKLSLTEANQYNQKDFYSSLSIMELLKASEIQSYWISNQTLRGPWDNIVSAIAERSDQIIMLNASIGATSKMQYFDDRTLEELQKIINTNRKKNKVIFIHLMGSHSPYDSRYPKAGFSKFTTTHQGDIGFEGSQFKNLPYYDNSVYYNDYVVSSILKVLKQLKGANTFFYMADHADDVMQQKGHNSGAFSYEMTDIPMMCWMSADYRKKYPEIFPQLLKNRNKWFSNDLLFNTLLGILQIESPYYDSKYDYCSADYLPTDSTIKVLHKRLYNSSDNHIYWQKTNSQYLIDHHLSQRIYPHRVNSLAKLQQVLKSGFSAFEVDIYFEKDSTRQFRVGHHKGKMGHDLETFLNSIEHNELQKVWLDLKNLDKNNVKEVIEELKRLDHLFHIKEKALIESGTKDTIFQMLHQNGWKTSYYLPTNQIVELLESNNKESLKIFAKQISQQILKQQVSAISFDDRLYPFVKSYLEALISPSIVYHCWYGPSLKSTTFEKELTNHLLFQNPRVKSLLTPYYSLYHL
jgi:glucan phosphoethanolaminetransferase (alkaline phosphatase superfamily)